VHADCAVFEQVLAVSSRLRENMQRKKCNAAAMLAGEQAFL
jgi:hypothetical protein